MDSVELSVIIPIYNPDIEQFQRTVENLREVALPMEILLVDDGSKPYIRAFCERELNDGRARYIWQENAGVSAARNAGIERARGRYLFFLDADDEIPPEFVDFLNHRWNEVQGDWVLFNILEYRIKTGQWVDRRMFERDCTLMVDQAIDLALKGDLYECWGKLIAKESLLRFAIRFPVGMTQGEDARFNTELLLHVSNVQAFAVSAYVYFNELKNTDRLFKNPRQRFADLEQSVLLTVGLLQKRTGDNAPGLEKAHRAEIARGVGSDCIWLSKAGLLDRELRDYLNEWLHRNVFIDGVRISDANGLKGKLYFFLLRWKLWGGFWILGKMKRSRPK